MKERPILLKGEMVRALLAGTKTQTRRIVKVQPFTKPLAEGERYVTEEEYKINSREGRIPCPYGKPGDRLWVRETFMDLQGTGVEHRDSTGKRQRYAYGAEFPLESYGDSARKDYGLKWKPSIHMPRAASRILLEIVSVRVEQLNDCSEADAIAEGVGALFSPLALYSELWESINGAGSWAANPWVWVVEFKRVTP